ncbi:MAG: C69 family dipeptidase [Bacteroidales bacterium]|nr:C69 family dipeptidase [Bacteroidales bacterium]
MRKILCTLFALALLAAGRTDACTNVIVTPGASADGSSMVSYAADSHGLFGELYFRPAARFRAGTALAIREWDTGRPLGSIDQVARTWQTVGNINERQLIIGETTWGGREEQADPAGIMDYGSLIYITLQRASTAREAIQTIVDLAGRYGYPSEGETFSIADPKEAWVMDLVGKGAGQKGIVWVARRIPDGYICAHANQARITRFPLDDPENCLYAPDVISFAREQGWYEGEDKDFSFRDVYNPLDFGGARACDARAWSAFNILGKGTFTYEEDGREVSRPAADWLDYAMGYDLQGEMPLWIKPAAKVGVADVAYVMRDHYEGTPMDMTQDIGAGGNGLPYRWRPMSFEWEGKRYTNERAIATQQTGFWFVAQARAWLPDEVGALIWFGCDDAATSYLTPVYASTKAVPECLREGNGDMLHYSPTSQFWMCNRVANACYKMYDRMAPVARAAAEGFERDQLERGIPEMDAKLSKLVERGRIRKARKLMTKYTVETAQAQFAAWTKLEELLLVKFIDGNIKAQAADGSFLHTEYGPGFPDKLEYGGYNDIWKAAVARDPHSPVLESK